VEVAVTGAELVVALSLLAKIPLFLAFLVFVVAWILATLWAIVRFVLALETRSTAQFLFGRVLPLDLLGIVGLVGILGLTALFFDYRLVVLFVLASVLGYVLTYVLWEIVEPLDRPIGSLLVWSNGRLMLNQRYEKVNTIVSSVLFAGVIVALAWIFFTEDVPSSDATQQIMRIFLVFLAVNFVLASLPQRIAPLLSMNVDEDLRTRILLLQLGGLFSWALYISLLAWSFGIQDSGAGVRVGSEVSASLSLIVVAIIAGVLAATSLLPYLLGWRRARSWRRRLLRTQRKLVDDLTAVLRAPGDRDYPADLARLEEDVTAERHSLVERDPAMQFAAQVETAPYSVDPKYMPLSQAYRDARDLDPRLLHLAFLEKFADDVRAIAEELAASKRKDLRRKRAESYAAYYAEQRQTVDARLKEESGRNWVWAGASLIVLPLLGGVLSKVGERLWEIVDTTPQ
jgi:hypothetical protein